MNVMFQQIFDKIQDTLPKNWEKVVFYAFFFEDSFQMKYFIKQDNSYKDCYSVVNLSDLQFAKLFLKINKIIKPYRKKGKENWTALTMSIDNKGNLKSSFEYEDFSEKVIEYEKKWKKKYLR